MPRLYQFIMKTCSNRMFYHTLSHFQLLPAPPLHSHPNSSPFSLLRKRKQTLEKHGVLILSAIYTWKCGWYIQCHSIGENQFTLLQQLWFATSFFTRQRALWPCPFFGLSFCLAWAYAGKAHAGYHSLCETLCLSVLWFWKLPLKITHHLWLLQLFCPAPCLHRSLSFEGRVW